MTSPEQNFGIAGFAIEQRKRKRENPEPKVYELEKPELEEVYSYPLIIPGERRLRGDMFGNMYLRSFRETKETDENGRMIVHIRWSMQPTIEELLGATDANKEAYNPNDGVEVKRLLEVKNSALDLRRRIQNDEFERSKRADEEKEVAKVLAETRYLDANKFRKKRMSDFLYRSVTPDSLNREYNPSRSILLQTHVIEDAEDEESFHAIGFAKYDFLETEIKMVANDVANDLKNIDSLMEIMEGMSDGNSEFFNAVQVLSNLVEQKASTDKFIPNPFLEAYTVTKVLVNGQTGFFDHIRLAKIHKNEEAVKLYLTQIPIVGLTSQRRIVGNINQCRAEIRSALNKGAIALGEKEAPSPKGLYG